MLVAHLWVALGEVRISHLSQSRHRASKKTKMRMMSWMRRSRGESKRLFGSMRPSYRSLEGRQSNSKMRKPQLEETWFLKKLSSSVGLVALSARCKTSNWRP